jgi:hypothetical protein
MFDAPEIMKIGLFDINGGLIHIFANNYLTSKCSLSSSKFS